MMKNILFIFLGILLGASSFYFYNTATGKTLSANLKAELAEYCQNLKKQ